MVGMGLTNRHHIKIAVEENALAVSPRLKWGGTTTKIMSTKKIVAIISHSLQ